MENNSKGNSNNHGGGRKKSPINKKIKSFNLDESLLNKLSKYRTNEITYSSMVEEALKVMILQREGEIGRKYTISEVFDEFQLFLIENNVDDIVMKKSSVEAFPIALDLALEVIRLKTMIKATLIEETQMDSYDEEIKTARAKGIKIYLSFWKVTEEEATAFFDEIIQKMNHHSTAAAAAMFAGLKAKRDARNVMEDLAEGLAATDIEANSPTNTWSKRLFCLLLKRE